MRISDGTITCYKKLSKTKNCQLTTYIICHTHTHIVTFYTSNSQCLLYWIYKLMLMNLHISVCMHYLINCIQKHYSQKPSYKAGMILIKTSTWQPCGRVAVGVMQERRCLARDSHGQPLAELGLGWYYVEYTTLFSIFLRNVINLFFYFLDVFGIGTHYLSKKRFRVSYRLYRLLFLKKPYSLCCTTYTIFINIL